MSALPSAVSVAKWLDQPRTTAKRARRGPQAEVVSLLSRGATRRRSHRAGCGRGAAWQFARASRCFLGGGTVDP